MERRGRDGRWVAAFYIRRAYRIYPLAIVCMLSYAAFQVPESVRDLVHPTQFVRLPPWQMFYNLALVQNLTGSPLVINVLWSLPLELQMYLVLPLCFLAAKVGGVAMGRRPICRWSYGVGGNGLHSFPGGLAFKYHEFHSMLSRWRNGVCSNVRRP